MSFVFGGLILPLLVIGGLVYAIVTALRRRSDDGWSPEGSAISLRRLFQYLLLAAALLVAAWGVAGVLGRAISDAAARRGEALAGPLALTVVGVPVFWLLGRWMWQQLVSSPLERRSVGWGLYLTVALVGSLSVGVGTAMGIASGYIEGDGYDGQLTAVLIVALVVWWMHWVAWRRVPPYVLPDTHMMAGAAIGLGFMAGGAGFVIASALERLFALGLDTAAGRFLNEDLSMAVVAVGIGLVLWSWHWLANGRDGERTTSWLIYVVLIGVLGGFVASVVGAAAVVYGVLEWVFGDPDATTAAAHFRDLSPAFAAALIGPTVWSYHRAVLGSVEARERTDIDRVYDYLISGVALATVAGAITTLIIAVFEVFQADDVVAAGGSDINVVLVAITLLVVGGPVWAVAWRRAQAAVVADREEEVTAPARRAYLFAVFGIGGAVAFGALIRLVFVLFEAALGERGSGEFVADLSLPVGLLVSTGAVAVYHWFIYREERTVEERKPWRDATLVWSGGNWQEIEKRARVRLNVLRRLDLPADQDGAVPSIDEIVAAIEAVQGERLLVVAGEDGVEIVPIAPR